MARRQGLSHGTLLAPKQTLEVKGGEDSKKEMTLRDFRKNQLQLSQNVVEVANEFTETNKYYQPLCQRIKDERGGHTLFTEEQMPNEETAKGNLF